MSASAILWFLTAPDADWARYLTALVFVMLSVGAFARDWRVMVGALLLGCNWLICTLATIAAGANDPFRAFLFIDSATGIAFLFYAGRNATRWQLVVAVSYAVQIVGHASYAIMHGVAGAEAFYRGLLLWIAWGQLLVVGSWGIRDGLDHRPGRLHHRGRDLCRGADVVARSGEKEEGLSR